MMIKSDAEAAAYSQQYSKIVLFNGVIYKNGDKYGKYEVTNTDPTDKIITYKTMNDAVVATMELKGVSPERAVLNLESGEATTLKMREMEIEVTEEDGAIYLIKEMILVKSEAVESDMEKDNVSSIEEVKADHKEATEEMNEVKTDDLATVKVTGNSEGNLDLRYGFKKGQKLHYKSVENTSIKVSMDSGMGGMDMGMPMGDMGMTAKFMIETDFNLNIISVNSDKSANFETVINSFKVYSMPGKKLMASDAGMKGLKVKGLITDKGVVTFLNDLYIVKTKNGETILVSAKASNKDGKLSASGTAEVDGEKVEVQATFNPKTGQLTSSTKITKVKKPAKKEIKITKEDNKIEVLPKQIMQLFLLPENKISLGQTVNFSAPMLSVKFNADKGGNADCIKLTSSFKTDTTNLPEGMDKEMMAMQPNMDAKVNAKFNTKKGCLKAIDGIINTNLNMQGIKMSVHSEIKMEKQEK
jgi:hypothetical protein